jgi:DNA-binding XRE family transcriptional regulator
MSGICIECNLGLSGEWMPKQAKSQDAAAMRKREEVRLAVGKRLREWRESTGVKKFPLAKRLGISHQRWFHYESGRNELDLMVALQLCEQEGLTMDYLYRNDYSSLPDKVRAKLLRHLAKSKPKS